MSNQQSSFNSQHLPVDADPSPTEKIYGLIAQLQARHDQAVAEMSAGYANGEHEAASKAMAVVRKVERLMPKVGSRARKYFLSKVQR